MTRVRKIGGDTEVFRQQLEQFLEPRPDYVRINPINGHIEMKVPVVNSANQYQLTCNGIRAGIGTKYQNSSKRKASEHHE